MVFQRYIFNPCGAETGLFWRRYVNIVATDDLNLHEVRTSGYALVIRCELVVSGTE